MNFVPQPYTFEPVMVPVLASIVFAFCMWLASEIMSSGYGVEELQALPTWMLFVSAVGYFYAFDMAGLLIALTLVQTTYHLGGALMAVYVAVLLASAWWRLVHSFADPIRRHCARV